MIFPFLLISSCVCTPLCTSLLLWNQLWHQHWHSEADSRPGGSGGEQWKYTGRMCAFLPHWPRARATPAPEQTIPKHPGRATGVGVYHTQVNVSLVYLSFFHTLMMFSPKMIWQGDSKVLQCFFINRNLSQYKMLPFTSISKEKEEEVDEVENRRTPSSPIKDDCSMVCIVDFLSCSFFSHLSSFLLSLPFSSPLNCLSSC